MPRLSPYRYFFEGAIAASAGRMLGRVAELQVPNGVLEPFVRAYVACLGVDMSEVLMPPGGFGSFGAFFARRLRSDARPVCREPGSVVSPCDGVVAGKGRLGDDRASGLVIKNRRYSVRELVGDVAVAAGLNDGGYCVVYLHPRDYHRVHIPVDGTLSAVRHIPGARYPMAPWASKFADGAWGKNERMAFDLELPSERRRCVLLMIAAFGVGGIECQLLPEKVGQERVEYGASAAVPVMRGDEIAAFRMGSTVALLWPGDVIELDEELSVGGRVLMGQRLGRVRGVAPNALRLNQRPGA